MAKKKKGRGRPPKHKSEKARSKHRREHGLQYYQDNKEEISKKRAKRWKDDPEYRERVRKRGEEERALQRAKKHEERLGEDKIKSEQYWKGRRTLTPRVVMLGGKEATVFSSGVLGRAVYRTMPTVRRWIVNRVLPGYSWQDEHGRYWFTREFCQAARRAIEKVYLYDGRRGETVTRQLLIEELTSAGITWSPFDEPAKKKGRKKKGRKKGAGKKAGSKSR